MKEELKSIIQNDYTITYKDEMTMEELVNEINKSNINLALSINTNMQILLSSFVKEIKKEISDINTKMDIIIQRNES